MLVYGKNVAKELLNTKDKVKKVYLQQGFKDEDILNKLSSYKVNMLDKKQLDKLTNGTHQGIALEIEDYNYYEESDLFKELNNNTFIVILDHIEDPHNFGAIIRTCEAAGVDFIVIPKDRSVKVNSTVMKVSAGTLDLVKIVEVVNINNFINKLKKANTWVVGTRLKDSTDYTKVDYTSSIALVIGNEGKGISPLVEKNCDYLVKIPMLGKTNSLNASVAAGILIYEVVRQRGNHE